MDNQPKQNTEVPTPPMEEKNTSVPNPPGMEIKPGEKHYGGFWIRMLGYLLDGIILGIITKILHVGGYSYSYGHMSLNYGMQGWAFLINLAYFVGFWVWKSATPGFMALGIKITDKDGKNITVTQSFIRYFSMILSAIPFFLGFIWIGFEKEKRGWHDFLAKTWVVYNK